MFAAGAVADTNHLASVVEPHKYFRLAEQGKNTAAAAADVVAAAAAHTQEHNFYENQMMEVSAKNKSKGQYRNM